MDKPKTKTKLEPPDGHARDYSSLIREANSFNGRLLAERTSRLPFIDNQTGVAQSDCNLWKCERDRIRCQTIGAHSSWGECQLYSYPNLIRRNRPQRNTELAKLSQSSINLCRLTGASASCGPSCGLEVAVNKERAGVMRAAAYATTVSHRDQQRPPRADSTGSHSFADSDSRDQSSTGTSQSVESPRSQLLDDEQPLSHLNYLTIGGEDKGGPKRDPLEHDNEDELSVSMEPVSFEVMKKSKLRRGRNMGSSLIRTVEQSLLIKSNGMKDTNSRTTTQNVRGTKKVTTNKSSPTQGKSAPYGPKQTQDARPYVCPICDQTYKTRPGLSYHFIHSHDTVLPRNLPVKIDSDKSVKSKRTNGSTTGVAKKSARTRTKHEEPTTRVLRRGRRSAGDQDGIYAEPNAQLDETQLRKTPERSPEESNRIRKEVSSEMCDADPEYQELNGPQAIEDEGKLEKGHGALDDDHDHDDGGGDDDNETVIEMSPSQARSTETVLCESLSTIQDEPSKNRPHEVVNETDQGDEGRRKADNDQTDPSRGQSKTNNRRNIFCDFCLGTVDKNRRTCLPEELISCSNCGSSGHPSCLRFSENICRSVKKYSWQCLECKTCSTCNQADHEDQMLFCDDCDRSYHTYCLSPRLEHPPEGSWTCRECLDEYYNDARK